MNRSSEKTGYLAGASAYLIWGSLPIYWKALSAALPAEILAHRILWSFVLLAVIDLVRTRGKAFRELLDGRIFRAVLLTGVLIAANWFIYIFAVNSGFIVEASLGYYINPIVSVLFGVIFLKEKLDLLKKIALALAAAGVLFITISFGTFPWISIVLAVTFGLYGLFKKIFGLDSLRSLLLETLILLIPSLVIIIGGEVNGTGHLLSGGFNTTLLFILAGPVTSVPLLLFAEGTRRIPLSAMGFLQYASPTLSLILGVFLYGETFTAVHLAAFGLIWAGLAVFTVSAFRKQAALGPGTGREA